MLTCGVWWCFTTAARLVPSARRKFTRAAVSASHRRRVGACAGARSGRIAAVCGIATTACGRSSRRRRLDDESGADASRRRERLGVDDGDSKTACAPAWVCASASTGAGAAVAGAGAGAPAPGARTGKPCVSPDHKEQMTTSSSQDHERAMGPRLHAIVE